MTPDEEMLNRRISSFARNTMESRRSWFGQATTPKSLSQISLEPGETRNLDNFDPSALTILFVVALAYGDAPLAHELARRLTGVQLAVEQSDEFVRLDETEEMDGEEMPPAPVYWVNSKYGRYRIDPNWLPLTAMVMCRNTEWLQELWRTAYQMTGDDLLGNTPLARMLMDRAGIPAMEHTNRYVADWAVPLPILIDGQVKSPDLFLALLDKQNQGFPASWFDDVLCFATPEMLEQHSKHLAPYDWFLEVVSCKEGKHSKASPLQLHPRSTYTGDAGLAPEQWRADFLSGLDQFVYGFEPEQEIDYSDGELIRYFASSPAKMAACASQTRILCRTTVSFLQTLVWEQPHEEIANTAAGEAINGYFPHTLICDKAVAHDTFERVARLAPVAKYPRELLKEFADSEMTARVFRKYVPPQVIDAIEVKLSQDFLSTREAKVWSLGLGRSTVGQTVSIDPRFDLSGKDSDDLTPWIDEGTDITFAGIDSPGTIRPDVVQSLLQRCRGPVLFDGVPSHSTPAELMAEYTKERRRDERTSSRAFAVTSLMHAHGPKEFLPWIKTKDDWDAAFKVFGEKSFADVPDSVPDSHITSVAVSILDL